MGRSERGYATIKIGNLRSAMRHSALWVYEKFAKAIGEEKARSYLKVESATIWTLVPRAVLIGSMESLLSLLKSRWFLKKLYQNDLPFELEHQRLLKDVMIVEAEKDWILRAKTGWEGRHGWWVGWVEWSLALFSLH